MLSDGSGDVRLAAVRALGALREPSSIPAIAGVLGDDSKYVVEAALEELSSFADPTTVSAILDLTRDPSPRLRLAAVKALAKLGDPRATTTLTSMLKGQPLDVRRAALRALVQIADPNAIEPLLAMLNPNDGDDSIDGVIRALGAIGDQRVIDALLSMLQHDQHSDAVIAALVELGAPAADAVLQELERSADSLAQARLLQVLARAPSSTLSPILLAALQNDSFPRHELLMAIAACTDSAAIDVLAPYIPELDEQQLLPLLLRLGERIDDRLSRPLIERYPNASPALRNVLLSSFANLKDPAALSIINDEILASDEKTRKLAMLAAQALASESSRPALLEALKDKDPLIREQAALALSAIATKDTIKALLAVAENDEHPAQRDALWALGICIRTQPSPAVVRFALERIEDPNDPLAYNALEVLSSAPPAGLGERFLELYQSSRISIRRKLVQMLTHIDSPQTREVALLAINEEDSALRAEGAWLLGWRAVEVEPERLLALADDPVPAVAANAIASIGRLRLQSAQPLLERRLYDRNPFVAANAIWALHQLDQAPELWDLQVLLNRERNAFLRLSIYRSLWLSGAQSELQDALQREREPELQAEVIAMIDEVVPPSSDDWLIIDLRRAQERAIGETAYLLLPDASIKAAHSDENGKLRIDLPQAGLIRQLYDSPFLEFAAGLSP
ncbi:MAG: HEAT repeat domain-containing protein, partial [Myxococcota bacterium]|jgi:HEAT repeat protein|nr:HEAT repeat domain-containing protein [Myxococcota bacterium]